MATDLKDQRRREKEERRQAREQEREQEREERREAMERHRQELGAERAGRRAAAGRDNVVACRLDDADLGAIDALVEAGIRGTRSDAAAWLVKAGIEANRELLDEVSGTVGEIRRLRARAAQMARRLTEPAAAGGPGSSPDAASATFAAPPAGQEPPLTPDVPPVDRPPEEPQS